MSFISCLLWTQHWKSLKRKMKVAVDRCANVSLGKQGKNQPVCYKVMFLIHTVKYEKAFSLIDFF